MAEMRLSLYIEAKQMDIDALDKLLGDERRAAALLEGIAAMLGRAALQQHGGTMPEYHVEAVNRTVDFGSLIDDIMAINVPEW